MDEKTTSQTVLAKTASFLALRRNTSLLLVMLVLAGTGERLWLGFAPKYLETLGAVYAYPGGWLTDHWGQRRSLLLFNALGTIWFWRFIYSRPAPRQG